MLATQLRTMSSHCRVLTIEAGNGVHARVHEPVRRGPRWPCTSVRADVLSTVPAAIQCVLEHVFFYVG